ncbi:MAG: sugar phosphate nucleotidyltransferase [Actinomycetales bacterium]
MNEISKAILLVGGKGTRLMPLTTDTPKPMLRIAGAPVTEHQIVKARDAGVTEIVLATSYLAEVFQPYFGDGSRFGIKISYAVETEPLGTGGAIANAAKALNLEDKESVYIFNGDVLSLHDLKEQARLHQENGADATLHLIEVADARAFGCVPIDQTGRVLEFLEKMEIPKANTINAGCYIFTSESLSSIPRDQVISVERETFPKWLAENRNVFGYLDSNYWIDMGTPESMIKASRDLVSRKAKSIVAPDVELGPNSIVDNGSYIDSGARIGADCRISGSIIGAKALIEDGSKIENSYVAPNSRVKSGSILSEIIHGFAK